MCVQGRNNGFDSRNPPFVFLGSRESWLLKLSLFHSLFFINLNRFSHTGSKLVINSNPYSWFFVYLLIGSFFLYLQKSKGIGAIGIGNTQHCQHQLMMFVFLQFFSILCSCYIWIHIFMNIYVSTDNCSSQWFTLNPCNATPWTNELAAPLNANVVTGVDASVIWLGRMDGCGNERRKNQKSK